MFRRKKKFAHEIRVKVTGVRRRQGLIEKYVQPGMVLHPRLDPNEGEDAVGL